jgi:dipeptidase E
MKLVLYSGGQSKSNHHLHRAVVDLALESRAERRGQRHAHRKELQFTYIPFCEEDSNIYFSRAKRRYRAHGVENFLCLSVERKPSAAEFERAFASDIIYLAGGNTFYFLKHLRTAGAMERLKKFAEKGGVIAGALIMSPTVRLAADPGLGPDENEVGLKNHDGLGLFQFEFSPHYEPTKKQINAHLAYSLRTQYPVFAIEDGAGIIINDEKIAVQGKGTLFYRGTETRIR